MSNETDPQANRLTKIFGRDPAKPHTVTSDMLQEVMKGLDEADREAAKEKATALLTQAVELRKKKVNCVREHTGQIKKFDKEMGKLLNRIESMVQGTPIVEESDEDTQE